MKILVLNGPNLNRMGKREPVIYGTLTLAQIRKNLEEAFPEVDFEFYQSNHEGGLIDRLQQAEEENVRGIVFNPGGYGHTSVALRDAVKSIEVPVIEVHISNVYSRERFRHHSHIAAVAEGQITGLGGLGYHLAVRYFLDTE
jgi:3-dehydroquinate dehydratase-2